MQAAEIQQLLRATPFEAFTVHTGDGRQFSVKRQDRLGFSRDKSSIAVGMPAGGFAILDLRLATHIEPKRKSSRGRKH